MLLFGLDLVQVLAAMECDSRVVVATSRRGPVEAKSLATLKTSGWLDDVVRKANDYTEQEV